MGSKSKKGFGPLDRRVELPPFARGRLRNGSYGARRILDRHARTVKPTHGDRGRLDANRATCRCAGYGQPAAHHRIDKRVAALKGKVGIVRGASEHPIAPGWTQVFPGTHS